MAKIGWEMLEVEGRGPKWVYRAKVKGGWLVAIDSTAGSGVTFVPDPNN
jgi:hypothetical protein